MAPSWSSTQRTRTLIGIRTLRQYGRLGALFIGVLFAAVLLGVSCFVGLAVTCLFLPLNHFAGKVVVGAEESLMKARDERVGLMNEILGGIRMLKVRSAKFLERVGEGVC